MLELYCNGTLVKLVYAFSHFNVNGPQIIPDLHTHHCTFFPLVWNVNRFHRGKRRLNLLQSEFRMSVWPPWPPVWVSGWRQPTFRTNEFPQKNQYHCVTNSFLGRIHVDNLGVIDAILSRGFSCYTTSSNIYFWLKPPCGLVWTYPVSAVEYYI